jgi:hypothetical protein
MASNSHDFELRCSRVCEPSCHSTAALFLVHLHVAKMPRPKRIDTRGAANTARTIYTVKDVRQAEVSWSRFEFVTPPKWAKFTNKNLSVIRNRDQQRRAALGIA